MLQLISRVQGYYRAMLGESTWHLVPWMSRVWCEGGSFEWEFLGIWFVYLNFLLSFNFLREVTAD